MDLSTPLRSGRDDVIHTASEQLEADNIPAAPWTLTGSAVIMLTKARPSSGVLLAFVHYDSSPVGPYDELARIGLTLQGPSVLEMLVTSEATRQGGRRNWGFPKELADLHWQECGNRITFRAGADTWRFRACGPSLPIRLSGWTVQQLEGAEVKVPVKLRGQVRLAFNGKRMALAMSLFEMQVLPSKYIYGQERRTQMA